MDCLAHLSVSTSQSFSIQILLQNQDGRCDRLSTSSVLAGLLGVFMAAKHQLDESSSTTAPFFCCACRVRQPARLCPRFEQCEQ